MQPAVAPHSHASGTNPLPKGTPTSVSQPQASTAPSPTKATPDQVETQVYDHKEAVVPEPTAVDLTTPPSTNKLRAQYQRKGSSAEQWNETQLPSPEWTPTKSTPTEKPSTTAAAEPGAEPASGKDAVEEALRVPHCMFHMLHVAVSKRFVETFFWAGASHLPLAARPAHPQDFPERQTGKKAQV